MHAKADSSPDADWEQDCLNFCRSSNSEEEDSYLEITLSLLVLSTADLVTHLKSRPLGVRQPTDENPMKLLRSFPWLTALDRSEESVSSLLSTASAITT